MLGTSPDGKHVPAVLRGRPCLRSRVRVPVPHIVKPSAEHILNLPLFFDSIGMARKATTTLPWARSRGYQDFYIPVLEVGKHLPTALWIIAPALPVVI